MRGLFFVLLSVNVFGAHFQLPCPDELEDKIQEIEFSFLEESYCRDKKEVILQYESTLQRLQPIYGPLRQYAAMTCNKPIDPKTVVDLIAFPMYETIEKCKNPRMCLGCDPFLSLILNITNRPISRPEKLLEVLFKYDDNKYYPGYEETLNYWKEVDKKARKTIFDDDYEKESQFWKNRKNNHPLYCSNGGCTLL